MCVEFGENRFFLENLETFSAQLDFAEIRGYLSAKPKNIEIIIQCSMLNQYHKSHQGQNQMDL